MRHPSRLARLALSTRDEAISPAVLPIGDLFTMGIDDAVDAVKFLKPKHAIPSHFGTWPPIEQDPQKWAARVKAETSTVPVVLKPGETWKVP